MTVPAARWARTQEDQPPVDGGQQSTEDNPMKVPLMAAAGSRHGHAPLVVREDVREMAPSWPSTWPAHAWRCAWHQPVPAA